MKHSMLWTIPLLALLAFLPLPAVAAGQDDQHASHQGDWRDDGDKDRRDNDKAPASVTVSFGAGLNTAGMPPNPANNHILPKTIEVRAGGVVNFVVAGFHQIFVYNPGVTPFEVLGAAPAFPPNLFVNYGLPLPADPAARLLFYVGINPGGNTATPDPPPTLSNAANRVESILFPEPGKYLVICNVNPHFREGMWAWVKVSK
jgi:hypothetical protein